jgi:hypothetical protein
MNEVSSKRRYTFTGQRVFTPHGTSALDCHVICVRSQTTGIVIVIAMRTPTSHVTRFVAVSSYWLALSTVPPLFLHPPVFTQRSLEARVVAG